MNEETPLDALEWVNALILHYGAKYSSKKTLDCVLNELQTCIAIGKFRENDGTRFKEATEKLRGLIKNE